jgi:hypothetical protein
VWLALALLLLNALRLIYLRQPKREPNHIVSMGQAGEVRVAREAVEGGLRAAGEKLAEVTRVRVHVGHRAPRRVEVRVFYMAAEGVQIMQVSGRLRDALRQRFGELVQLPPEHRVEFQLEFEGFSGKLPRRSEANKPKEPQTEDAPFTGPRYPIDDGEE